jgi:hypothetical protein
VIGQPRGSRVACTNAGGECGGACDGIATAQCEYPNEVKSCGAATCALETEYKSYCDGRGACGTPVGSACVKFSCGPTGCRTSCDVDSDCGTQFKCDVAKRDCVPSGVLCDGDHTLVSKEAPPTDCTPYKCNATNVCLGSCTSRADCVAQMACTSDGKCVSLTAVVAVANKSGSMCSVTAGPAGVSYKALLAGLMIAMAWVRRWPGTGRICPGHPWDARSHRKSTHFLSARALHLGRSCPQQPMKV